MAGPNFRNVPADRVTNAFVKLQISLGVLGVEIREKSQKIVEHLHLAVAKRPGADSDGGDPE